MNLYKVPLEIEIAAETVEEAKDLILHELYEGERFKGWTFGTIELIADEYEADEE